MLKMTRILSIVLLVLLSQIFTVLSFGTLPTSLPVRSSIHKLSPKNTHINTAVLSTKTNNFNSFNDIHNVGNDKRSEAKEAILKLIERQRQELKATEDLLANLNEAPSDLAVSVNAGVDYGFKSRSEGCRFQDINEANDGMFKNYGPPANILSLGKQQFLRNWKAMQGEYFDEEDFDRTPTQIALQEQLEKLTLTSSKIWERERARGEIVAPWVIKIPYYILCFFLDVVFDGKNAFSRFFLLETVARMPYFSYITMLHLYETLGFWRRSAEVKRVHFAEEWNEFHHLLIMESLGGDQPWWVRFLSQHSAIVYFIVLTHLFALSPSLSYKFSEMLETHAVDTYGQFLDENEALLKTLPPPLAAIEYYTLGITDPLFGEYQTTAQAKGTVIRKPGERMNNLYEVFSAIRADEGDHVGTMKACLDPSIPLLSPSLENRFLTGLALTATVGYFVSSGGLEGIGSSEFVDGAMVDPIVDSVLAGAAAVFGGSNMMEEATDMAEVEGLAQAGALGFFLEGLRSILLSVFRLL